MDRRPSGTPASWVVLSQFERVSTLPTPCLVVDVGAADRNIARAVELRGHLALRPHFKAHKCTTLMRRQLAAGGCVGLTCATAYEALRLARTGFTDILVANEVVNDVALDTLMEAARTARVLVAVDAIPHVELLDRRVSDAGVELGVLIEVDVGHHRCGVEPGSEKLLELARRIGQSDGIRLHGLMGFEGHAMLQPDSEVRRSHVTRAAEILHAERDRLEAAGYDCPIVSGGGTGTLSLARDAKVLTEVQIGSYVLLDANYHALDLGFEPALYCLATVISRRSATEAVIDAGLKSMSGEEGMPRPVRPGIEVVRLNDEHSVARVDPEVPLEIGEAILLIPAHIDPTINLHDTLFAFQSDGEVTRWPVDGRRVNSA